MLLWVSLFSGLLFEMHNKGGGIRQDFTVQNMFILATSLLGCVCAFLLVESFRNQKVHAACAFIYGILFFYFFRVNNPFSFPIVANNYEHLQGLSSFMVVAKMTYATYFASDVFWTLIFVGLLMTLGRLDKMKIPAGRMQGYFAAGSVAFILSISAFTTASYEPFSAFGQSVRNYYIPVHNILQAKAQNLKLLPALNSKSHFKFAKKPNIFLILIESFNSRFVNQKNENGVEYLPFFNELTRKHLYFSNYHSNSIQTAKGHFAALCGMIPMTRGIEFHEGSCLDKKCLATVLGESGYKTLFYQADPNYNSDNSQNFMKNHGFQETPELVKDCSQEKSKCYSFGIRDHLFYDRVFADLQSTADKTDAPPIFAAMATVSTHMPFSFQSEEERPIYKRPKSFKEQYLNTIRMADESLKVFIDRFENSPWAANSVLIITGDHAYPTGEHGSIHNDSFAFQENFGVPLLIYDRRQDLKSLYESRESVAASHLNLPMTIADIAQVDATTDWFAPSLFDESSPGPIYLVQPYSGGYQATIDWPYKHIYSEFRDQDTIYDLQNDPQELNPMTEYQNPELFGKMRTVTAQIHRQQDIFTCTPDDLKLSLNRGPAQALEAE
ncbi:MAG: LTA synthase family protein [Bdellovibrionaceae bacterium]|nr:LTA synthase family protein [Pseudobdellovibrionaceae bacterium]